MALCAAPVVARGFEQATTVVRVGMYVPPIVKWAGSHEPDDRAGATLTIRADSSGAVREASHVFRLLMNVDVIVRADVTPYRNRTDARGELDTYWRIVDDAGGDASRTGVTGADGVQAGGYASLVPTSEFLTEGLRVTHAPTDGAVKLTVTARATPPRGTSDAEDAEQTYDAHVTLTALPQTWLAPPFPSRRRAVTRRERP